MLSGLMLLLAGYFWGLVAARFSKRHRLYASNSLGLTVLLAFLFTLGSAFTPGPPLALLAFIVGFAAALLSRSAY
jgi:MFS family permease